ncbi:hypothetical protein BGX29_009557 [Mortierella sp. GBA35]|nr:hypothetical protein BGX23_008403 [Mortierella sp. AD031]KAF9094299.1 hypothetical protein BGX29_009557 [Mortierella sp. GBA35]KAG0211244.1 hypothetical protein BGX33_004423 [Mortierella sp. NVP41]
MCTALPGQVDCKRAGCSLPIKVEPNGRRHPFCSVECARACGENPRTPPQAMPIRTTAVPPPAYNTVGKFNKMGGKTATYPSPQMSDDSDNETLTSQQ